MAKEKIIEDTERFQVVLIDDAVAVLKWTNVQGLEIPEFQKAVASFARHVQAQKPGRIMVDAQKFDPGHVIVGWIVGQKKMPNTEAYVSWWTREIVPHYHDAGISSLAVITGDPNSPGEVPNVPPGVNFKMGYFPNFQSALQWSV